MCTSTFTAVMHDTHSNREACMNMTRARSQRLMRLILAPCVCARATNMMQTKSFLFARLHVWAD